MKRLILTLSSAMALVASLLAPLSVSAATDVYQLKVSPLQSTQNTSTFNVQYVVTSTAVHDFTVSLYEDGSGSASGVQHTQVAGDSHTDYGNSGTFAVTVADGEHTFLVKAVRDSDSNMQSGSTSTSVDTVSPGAPTYNGKTQSGNTYTINFVAPSSSDVTNVKVYTSTSKTYTADSAHQVGNVAVTPNQVVAFSYTAPDGTTRYFSVQAFDAAGNGSSIVGDPGTVVNPVVFVNQGGAVATAQTAAATTPATTAGQVQGANTTTPNTGTTGQVNATGKSTNSKSNKGKVLGAATTKNSSKKGWYYGAGAAILVLLAAYWLYSSRSGKGLFKKTS